MKLLKFKRTAALLLVFYVLFSLFLILMPSFEAGYVTTVFRKYLLPGPFFTEDRISQSYSLLVSYRLKGTWSEKYQPALQNYHAFIGTGNVANMYRTRLDRYFYYQYVSVKYKNPDSVANEQLKTLTRYFEDLYVPKEADSVKFSFTVKEVSDFKIKTDTLYAITRSCQH